MKPHRLPQLAAAAAVAVALVATAARPQTGPTPPAAPQGGVRKLDLPPIVSPPTGQRLPGKVIWFDLLTLEPEVARTFYAGVLGWKFEDHDGYLVASDGKTPVAGILAMPAPQVGAPTPQSRWMPLISVADLSRAVAAVQKGGGKVLEGPGSLGARGRYAAVADPRGAQFVLVTATGGDPVDADAPPPGWMWAELWTSDLKGPAAFYKSVVGYDTWQVGTGKQATWIFASGGRPRARASRMPFDKVPPQWLPYVVVKDLPGALSRVTELGGHVLRKPGAKGPQFAVVSDPGGAAFVLEQRPDQPAEEVAQSQLPATSGDAALAVAAGAAGAAGTAGVAGLTGPTGTADAFGIEAAEEKSRQDAAAAAAQAIDPGAVVQGVPGENVVVAPAPFVNVWIAPPAWGAFWGPGWAYPPGWMGAPWWGVPPPVWGPGWVPPPGYPGRPPYYPGYRPPPPRPYPPGARPPGPGTRPPGVAPAPRPSGSAPAYRAPSSGGSRPSGSSSGGSHSSGSHSGGRH